MITPNDPRHGHRAGYLAGCRSDCCRRPNIRYQKRSRVRLQLEGPQVVPAHAVVRRADWWARRGVSGNALANAAGVAPSTLTELIADERDVCLKSTARAILSVRWDHLPDEALCNAELTRVRVYSMMAAGHPLRWITDEAGPGLPFGGRWRHQARVTLATARAVLDLYDRAPLAGPSKITAAKAQNRGYGHPLSWDDPHVPAAPAGWRPVFATESTLTGQDRRLEGRGHHRKPDLITEYDHLIRCGESPEQACARLGVQPHTITDTRKRLAREAGESAA